MAVETVIIKCPECEREHHIKNHRMIKCICGSTLMVVNFGKGKELIKY